MAIKNKRIIFNPVFILLIVVSLVLLGIGLYSNIFTCTIERLTLYRSAEIYCVNEHVVNKGTKYCGICGAEAGFFKKPTHCVNCGKYVKEDAAQYCTYCGRESLVSEELIKPLISDGVLTFYWLLFIHVFLFMLVKLLEHEPVATTRVQVEGIAVHEGDDKLK